MSRKGCGEKLLECAGWFRCGVGEMGEVTRYCTECGGTSLRLSTPRASYRPEMESTPIYLAPGITSLEVYGVALTAEQVHALLSSNIAKWNAEVDRRKAARRGGCIVGFFTPEQDAAFLDAIGPALSKEKP